MQSRGPTTLMDPMPVLPDRLDAFVRQCTAVVTRAVPVSACAFYQLRPNGQIERFLQPGLSNPQHQDYERYYWHLDPLYPERALQGGTLLQSVGRLRRSQNCNEYYWDFLRRSDIGDVLEIYLRTLDQRPVAGLSLMRRVGEPEFSAEEIQALGRFHPLIEFAADASGAFNHAIGDDLLAARFEFTERELAVVRHLRVGLRNADIARAMAISVPTVKTHLRHLFEKAQVRNRVELLARIDSPMADPARASQAR